MTNIFYQFQKGKYTTTPYLLKITQPRQPHTAPIGIFDSGVGGISVLKELYRQLPKETFIYFADTARLPYGTKSQTEIVKFVRQVLTWMEKQGVKMAIIACNTATAAAIDRVALEYNFPVIGMIEPGAKTVVHRSSKRIGVIATPHTVKSNAYLNTILKIDPSILVFQVGAPTLVPLIEQGRINDVYTLEVVQQYLEPLIVKQIDTLILGCTHYPHLIHLFRRILGGSVQIVDPAIAVVRTATQELHSLGKLSDHPPHCTSFYVSGNPEEFAQRVQQFLGFTPRVKTICLEVESVKIKSESVA
ncbi:glutamate racemase [Dapis sp. BLCC M172]|uniref:glutamate racemase n=1 Tax=Dapis sp. BLCC M172 TaxID=2975281 RepID=UPI003CE93C03